MGLSQNAGTKQRALSVKWEAGYRLDKLNVNQLSDKYIYGFLLSCVCI